MIKLTLAVFVGGTVGILYTLKYGLWGIPLSAVLGWLGGGWAFRNYHD